MLISARVERIEFRDGVPYWCAQWAIRLVKTLGSSACKEMAGGTSRRSDGDFGRAV
jgi:hypothetical protein